MIKSILLDHYSQETAYLVGDYPYGGKRCQIRFWIEHRPKMGYRFVSQTENPKTKRWNNPKQGQYVYGVMFLYLDEKDHVHHEAFSAYDTSKKALEMIDVLSPYAENKIIAENLRTIMMIGVANVKQNKQYLNGERWFTVNGEKKEFDDADKERFTQAIIEWEPVVNKVKGILSPISLSE